MHPNPTSRPIPQRSAGTRRSGQMEKHREIAGKIEHYRQIMNALVCDLEALEHTIRMFDPDAALPRAKPVKAKDETFRGETRRDMLNALRTASRPLTSIDIARQIIAKRGLVETSPRSS